MQTLLIKVLSVLRFEDIVINACYCRYKSLLVSFLYTVYEFDPSF